MHPKGWWAWKVILKDTPCNINKTDYINWYDAPAIVYTYCVGVGVLHMPQIPADTSHDTHNNSSWKKLYIPFN